MSLTRSTSVLNETSNSETILLTICLVDHLSNVNPANHHHSFPPSNASQDPKPQPITIAPALADSTHPSLDSHIDPRPDQTITFLPILALSLPHPMLYHGLFRQQILPCLPRSIDNELGSTSWSNLQECLQTTFIVDIEDIIS
ncbi:hypothetical protein FRC02_005230 [Tulasnella sp. 418]|nr:hypothetical protein FRC02_005230 [Tulasnella sp. 418]